MDRRTLRAAGIVGAAILLLLVAVVLSVTRRNLHTTRAADAAPTPNGEDVVVAQSVVEDAGEPEPPDLGSGHPASPARGKLLALREHRSGSDCTSANLASVDGKIITSSSPVRVFDPSTVDVRSSFTTTQCPHVAGGVLVGSSAGTLYVHDALDGHELWHNKDFQFDLAVASSERLVLSVPRLRAYDVASGTKSWSASTQWAWPLRLRGGEVSCGESLFDVKDGTLREHFSDPIVAFDDKLVIVHAQRSSLEAYERGKARRVWYRPRAHVAHTVAATDIPIASDDDVVAVPLMEGSQSDFERAERDHDYDYGAGPIVLLDARTGATRWTSRTFFDEQIAAIALEKDIVWVLPSDGALRGFSRASGQELWWYPVRDALSMVAVGQRVWVLTRKALLVLEPRGSDDPPPPKHHVILRARVESVPKHDPPHYDPEPNARLVVNGEIVRADAKGNYEADLEGDTCVMQHDVPAEMSEPVSSCEGTITLERAAYFCRGDCN